MALAYIQCALKENFSVTLKGFARVSPICRELLVRSRSGSYSINEI